MIATLVVMLGLILLVATPIGRALRALGTRPTPTSGAIFLILEMNTPLDGMVTVSMSPMHEALAVIGH